MLAAARCTGPMMKGATFGGLTLTAAGKKHLCRGCISPLISLWILVGASFTGRIKPPSGARIWTAEVSKPFSPYLPSCLVHPKASLWTLLLVRCTGRTAAAPFGGPTWMALEGSLSFLDCISLMGSHSMAPGARFTGRTLLTTTFGGQTWTAV